MHTQREQADYLIERGAQYITATTTGCARQTPRGTAPHFD